jgi:outer membrane protein insertion porin family
MHKYLVIILFSLFLSLNFVYAEEVIFKINIEGNEIVSNATIISKIKIRAGQPYNENIINEDIKNLYASGFFETVEAKKEDKPEGVIITFKVKEKSVLKKVDIEGAHYIRKKQILESVNISEGSFVDEYKIKEAVKKIKDLYSAKGFSQVEITYDVKYSDDKKKAELKFVIDEKSVIKVRKVTITGNRTFSTRRILRLMKTRKAWLFNKGAFKEETLSDDKVRINDFYKSQGFGDVKVTIDVEKKAKGLYLTVNIVEGRRYYIGEVKVEGNKEISTEEIMKALEVKKEGIFSSQATYEGSSQIRGVYVDKGYIFSQVESFNFFNPESQKVDINYKIIENEVAYIEDIEIRGNIKTKDKVVRRELRVYPGDKFDGKKVKRSKEKLENLGFFEEIRFGTEAGSEPNNVDLIVDVKEAKTGYISFGGGYSSVDEFIGFAEIRQRNFDYKNFSTFTGAGQDLSLMVSAGTTTNHNQLSFTNPWIFDTPYYFGFDAYKKGHKQNDDVGYAYDEDVTGGDLRLGREFNDFWKGAVAYRLDRVEISDVVSEATQELKDEVGTNNLSSGELMMSYDSRDNVFSTLKGIYFTNNLQVFGGPFGGDKDFFKYFNRTSFYLPLIRESVVELRLRSGFSDPFSSTDKVPIYERFFAGGASTIRGYHERKVGPIDAVTEEPIGGEAMFVGNIEYTYPLSDFLKAATFFDTGEVWKSNSDFLQGGFKSSVGLGLRIKTPIGPVSLDYGWPLDTEPGEEGKEGRFHFNVSRSF